MAKAQGSINLSGLREASKTATNHLSYSTRYGLIIAEDATEDPEEMEGGSTRVTYDGVEMYKGRTRVAKFGETSIIGDEDSAHAYLDPDTFNITNEYGAEFFAVDMDGTQQVVPYYKTVSSVIEVSSEASMTISDSPDFDFVADGSNIAVGIMLLGGGFIDEADWNVVKGTAETTTVTSVAGTPFTLTYDGEHTFTVAWNNTIRRSGRLDIIEKPVMATPSLTCGTRRGTRGAFSSVMGQELTAEYPLQVVFGRHNVNRIYNLLEIGWGTYNTPRTVFAVDEVGNVECNNLPAMMECGQVITDNVASHSYADYTVSFDKNFTSAPKVVVGMMSASTGYGCGSVSVSAHSITTTGFTVRIFNNDSTARSPYVHWIAMQSEALIHT